MARPPRFDIRPRPPARRGSPWRRARSFVLLALTLGALWLTRPWWQKEAEWTRVTQEVRPCGEGPAAICAIDGDTLAWGRRRIRLIGHDAPELDGECPAESALAMEAKAALAEWLSRGAFEMDGGEDPPRDQYGRELRAVRRVDGEGRGEWLVETMVDAGLARRSEWGDLGGGWC